MMLAQGTIRLVLSALEQLDLFRSLPADGLALIAERSRVRHFHTGSAIVHQGDVGDTMHLIVSGRVQVERSHPELLRPLVLAELGEGEVVGEMGVLDGQPRSATVIALDETETIEMDAALISETLLRYPQVATILLRSLSRRLRDADGLAAQMMMQGRDETPI